MHSVIGQTLVPASQCEPFDFDSAHASWACRHLPGTAPEQRYGLLQDKSDPKPADLAVFEVGRIGHHRRLETDSGSRIRLYEGDRIIGVFANRYATDVFEGRVQDLKKLHLLTASGLVGTVTNRNREVGRPTSLSFLGYIGDQAGTRANTKQQGFSSGHPTHGPGPDVILVVGTGMNSGKTTVTRKALRALVAGGAPVAGCKLTGSASPRDLFEMRATGALLATDFSDYGFPSTSGESLEDLIRLMDLMTAACGRAGARIVIMEIADGILQPETLALLESAEVRSRVRGVVVAGLCSASLLYATDFLHARNLDVWAVSGLITNAPLFLREFSERSPIPVASSRGSGRRLARILVENTAKALAPAQAAERDAQPE
jgi:hypothetical protein